MKFIRQPPLPIPARPPYALLFAGAAATLPADYRKILGLNGAPLPVMKPVVSAMLASLGAVLGRQSPSQRNARRRLSSLTNS